MLNDLTPSSPFELAFAFDILLARLDVLQGLMFDLGQDDSSDPGLGFRAWQHATG